MAVIDPYRTLGLSPGATIEEVKAAYRRLAKRYHPDSAGPAAVSRFLEVQHAYEMLLARRFLRPAAQSRPTTRPTPRPRPSAQGSGAGPSTQRTRPRSGSGQATTGRGERSRSGRRKATMGSTSYDEATIGPLDPGWAGASWYGTESGTYWTVNPREYADPRKHGPEYQERARRAATGDAPSPPGHSPSPPGHERVGPEREARAPGGWATAHREPSAVQAGPRYPGIVAVGLALIGTVIGLMAIFALFART